MSWSHGWGKRKKKKVPFHDSTQVPSYNRDKTKARQVTVDCGSNNEEQQEEEIVDFDSSSSIEPSILFENYGVKESKEEIEEESSSSSSKDNNDSTGSSDSDNKDKSATNRNTIMAPVFDTKLDHLCVLFLNKTITDGNNKLRKALTDKGYNTYGNFMDGLTILVILKLKLRHYDTRMLMETTPN